VGVASRYLCCEVRVGPGGVDQPPELAGSHQPGFCTQRVERNGSVDLFVLQ
jgi:hypothetical protein